ncbi:efflux RND transporter periplasmic adaptor subunit [Thiolapillus sp.]|uniref:efflux RND transporter periplasmic adaptor subunit n=1 Tax=Thiolapillus sp. TaxID=2017437 RepID=UPI003AF9F3B4
MRFVLTMVFLGISLAACEEKPKEAPPPPPPEVTVLTVVEKDTPLSFEFVGKTVSSRKVEIRSRVEGFLEKRLYQEGSRVKEGQPMFQMDAKPFEADVLAAKAGLAQQEARLKTATINLNRVRPLARKKAVAQKELDEAEGNYYSAAAAVEAAKANLTQAELKLGYTLIKSPVSGLSSYAVQQEGAYIGMGTGSLLTYVAQIDPMWVELSISENQTLQYARQKRAGLVRAPENDRFTIKLLLADGREYAHEGVVTFADASISEQTGTFLVRAEVANPDDILRPGQFVRVLLQGAIRPHAILLPKIAVQQGKNGSFVWVIDDQDKAQYRAVEPGPWQGENWFIDDGLKAGDRVVVEGAGKLREGVKVSIASAKPEEGKAAAGDKPAS